jgi:hypothetical protein
MCFGMLRTFEPISPGYTVNYRNCIHSSGRGGCISVLDRPIEVLSLRRPRVIACYVHAQTIFVCVVGRQNSGITIKELRYD